MRQMGLVPRPLPALVVAFPTSRRQSARGFRGRTRAPERLARYPAPDCGTCGSDECERDRTELDRDLALVGLVVTIIPKVTLRNIR